ncbi:uncharacterized protein EDB93DRAFT_1245829 [Suillus bovinus]|uniref:uncharacterized protein n=1 Tax=Suillus bovinus TaxID=48563 RepID=UPI001B866B0A|nr:uncharacterized protein EDB93DRAFT_1245829 [Suillus bovinus]KAG2158599.1 hypothetical protein EDB93DRAFT_1245829 [Suillus bovinus]
MTSTSTPSDASSTISIETITGIVIGVAGGVAVVAVACFYLRCWWRRKGKCARVRKSGRGVDPEEEFVSGVSNFSIHDRLEQYSHRQQPSVSLEPLLLPSPPHASQDTIPGVSAPQIPLDWSYHPPILPNTSTDHNYFSLYDTDDPFARIQRAIPPTYPAHHRDMPVSTRRVSHEVPLEQYSRHTAKNPGPNSPLFINRTLTRHSGPDFFPGRASTFPFSSADPPQSISSQSGSDTSTVHLFAEAPLPTPPPKPRISILSPLAEHTSTPREVQPQTAGSEVDAYSHESIYSQESAQHPSHPPEPQLPSQSSKKSRSSQRYSRSLTLSDLSPVIEGSTSMSEPPSNDISEMQKRPSLTFSELERSSSLSVALSHNTPSTAPEFTSFPLLSSNDAFRKSGYSASTLSPSSSRATRYPSLAASSSGSNPPSNSATEWQRPPAGLSALTCLQTLDLPNPHAPTLEIPKVHTLPPAHRQPLTADDEKAPLTAHLRAHSPCCVPEVEQRSIIQCGIASIDVTL